MANVADLFTSEAERTFAFLRDFAKTHYEFLGFHVVNRYVSEIDTPISDIKVWHWRGAAARAVDERIICQVRLTPAGAANPPQAPIWRSLIYRGNVVNEEWSQR